MSADVTRSPAPTADLPRSVPTALPRQFYGWLGAATVSVVGDGVLYFALGWAATGIGPTWAGLTLTMSALPRAILLPLGGAVADRWGPRRIMIAGDAIMCALTLLLALAAHLWRTSGPLLMGTGLAIGVVGAFYLPATGAFPRLLVADEQLPRALALRQSSAQIVSLIGAPTGGALVALGGLVSVAAVDSSTFALVLGVLCCYSYDHSTSPRYRQPGHEHVLWQLQRPKLAFDGMRRRT